MYNMYNIIEERVDLPVLKSLWLCDLEITMITKI